jgi:hypothetical protein
VALSFLIAASAALHGMPTYGCHWLTDEEVLEWRRAEWAITPPLRQS